MPGGSLEPALEYQREGGGGTLRPKLSNKAQMPGLYLAWPAAMTHTGKLMMEVKHQNTEKSKGQQRARGKGGAGCVTMKV